MTPSQNSRPRTGTRRPWRLLRSVAPVALAAVALAAGALVPSLAQADVVGPDVSSHQHPRGAMIDWAGPVAAGSAFAFVKASEGTTYTNPYFAGDWASLASVGTIRGAYHYARPTADLNSAVAQAQHFVAVTGPLGAGTLPPVLDLEVTGGLSPAALVAWAQTYMSTVATLTSRTPILYTYSYFVTTALANSTALSAYPLWIANYGGSPPAPTGGWASWTFWQYTSSATVPGISTQVDMSEFNGSYDDLRALALLGPAAQPLPVVPAAPVPATLPLTGAWTRISVVPGGAHLAGWAADPDAPDSPVDIAVTVDARQVAAPVADRDRPDLATSQPGLGTAHGLDLTVNLAPGTHDICLTATAPAAAKSTSLGCRKATVSADPAGFITVTRTRNRITATGWALDPQTSAPIRVRLLVNGRLIRAFLPQAAAPATPARYASWGSAHGFTTSYPVHGRVTVCLMRVNWSYGANKTSCYRR